MPADGPEEETCSEFPTNHLNLWGVWTSDVNRPKSLFSNLKRTMDPVSVVLRSKRGITGTSSHGGQKDEITLFL